METADSGQRLAALAAIQAPGSYLLVLRTTTPLTLPVGRLGRRHFPPGWHVYVGSARRGLGARLAHHLRPLSRPHWHIDTLRSHATLVEVWALLGRERYECALAAQLTGLPGAGLAAGFGSSDCRCPGHLVSFSARPALETLGGGPVRLA
ncbi:MAG: GIY-YIG nuclease family protein [Chloroflexi bacterium]|nr:GIY-YIG nuclease family protein [Chloroflexota bacterium]